MKISYTLFLLLACTYSNAQTEKNVNNQNLLWTRYYNQLTLDNKWSIHTELDNRVFLKPSEQNLYVMRSNGRYKINPQIEIGAGFAYFSVATQDPKVHYNFSVSEYRGLQDIIWKQDFNKFALIQRLQVEERFFHNANKIALLPGTTFYWRFRYRIQGDFLCWKKENQFLKAIVYDELMINSGKNVIKNTFDQNRIYGALQYGVNKNIALELGYLNSFQQRASGIDYFNRDIIRFTIFHKRRIQVINATFS